MKCYFCKKKVPKTFHATFTVDKETELRYAHWECVQRPTPGHYLNLIHKVK